MKTFTFENKLKHDTRFDFMKVVAMIFIVLWHVNQHASVNGGGTWSLIKQPISLSMVIMTLIGTGGQIAVTVFIMISSWLMAERKTADCHKVVLLILKTSIISVGVYLLAYFGGLTSFSAKTLIKEIITPFYTQYWFITCYCIYYFLVPLLNSWAENKTDAALKVACLTLILMVTIYHAIIGGPFGDIAWFIFIHISVLYMKRVTKSWNIRRVNGWTVSLIVLWYIALFVNLLLIRRFSSGLCDFIFNLLVYRSLPVFLISVGLFESGRRFSHVFSSLWTKLAIYTLPIYIVHENLLWYTNVEGSLLWNDVFKIENFCHSQMILLWIPAVVGIVFLCGILSSKIADLIISPFAKILKRTSDSLNKLFGQIYE